MNTRKHIITKEEDLSEYKDDWNKLCLGNDMTIFQSFEWNKLLIREWNQNPIRRLIEIPTLYLLEDESLKMICLVFVRRFGLGGKKRGIYIQSLPGYTDYNNIIYSEFAQSSFEFLINTIKQDNPSLPIFFNLLRSDSDCGKYLLSTNHVPFKENVSVSVFKYESLEEYKSTLSKHNRQNLRTALNRINRDHINYEIKVTDGLLDDSMVQVLKRIHVKRFYQKNLKKETIRSWIKSIIRIIKNLMIEDGSIVYQVMRHFKEGILVQIFLNGDLAGYLYGVKDHKTIRILQNCVIEDAYGFYSPMYRGAYDFICELYGNNEIEEVDFTRGNEQYKYALGGKENKLLYYIL